MNKRTKPKSPRLKIIPASKCISYDWVLFLGTFAEYVGGDSVVLEIGSSVVDNSRDLARSCHKLTGLELIPEQVPEDFENATFLQGDWQELSESIEPESVDIVVANHVIEHVENDRKALEETYKVLRPGGVAIIVTPNRKRFTRTVAERFSRERRFPRQIVRTRDVRGWATENFGAVIADDEPLGDVKYVVEHQREYTEQDLEELVKGSPFTESEIVPMVFGLHGGPLFVFLSPVPERFRKYANFWMLILAK